MNGIPVSYSRSLLVMGLIALLLGLVYTPNAGERAEVAVGAPEAVKVEAERRLFEQRMTFRVGEVAVGAVMGVFALLLGAAPVSTVTREVLGLITGMLGVFYPFTMVMAMEKADGATKAAETARALAPMHLPGLLFFACLGIIAYLQLFRRRGRVVLPTNPQ